MIDLHAHIIPGVDDGAKDLDLSLEMLRQAYDYGVTTVCATPHLCGKVDPQLGRKILCSFDLLKRRTSEDGIEIELILGSEIHIQQDLQGWENYPFFTYDDNKKYLLLELPLGILPADLETVVFDLRMEGLVPIVAHPERNIVTDSHFLKMERLRDLGALLQVNSGSLLGYGGKRLKKITERLVRTGLATLVASDAHDQNTRSFRSLAGVLPEIERLLGKEAAFRLMYENPKRIIAGERMENDQCSLPAEEYTTHLSADTLR
ncbi:MAG: tyrosine-protein phosphatase [Candidatus Zixiibacteriota bacterium]